MGSVVVWTLAKQNCRSLHNFVMPLGLDFMPPDQIGRMSLNGSYMQTISPPSQVNYVALSSMTSVVDEDEPLIVSSIC